MVTRLEFCLGQLLPPFPGGLWTASQHHKGIQRLLVLLDELPVYSVLCRGPLLNLWERFNCTGPRLPLGPPPQKKSQPNVLCWLLHPKTTPPSLFSPSPRCLSVFLLVRFSYWVFISEFHTHFWDLIFVKKENTLESPPFVPRVAEHWKFNVLVFVSGRIGIEEKGCGGRKVMSKWGI